VRVRTGAPRSLPPPAPASCLRGAPVCVWAVGYIGKGIYAAVYILSLQREETRAHVFYLSNLSGLAVAPPGAARGIPRAPGARRQPVCVSLSYIITRVAPHCVNTLRILHAAYDATNTRDMSQTCPLVN
jgi:hypothetical protein